jgi:hypothetical protein
MKTVSFASRKSFLMAITALSVASFLSGCGGGDDYSCVSNAESGAALARCSAKTDDLIEVTLAEVRPTQPSLGYDEVYYKLGRYSTAGKDAVNKRFADWCEANGQLDAAIAPAGATIKDSKTFTCKLAIGAETAESRGLMKTAVIGPKGIAYLTDGHHTFTSFLETPDGGAAVKVRVRVPANLSNMSEAAFWQEMEKQQYTWLRDTDDKPITPQQLPTSVGLKNFGNDPYRGALYFARDVGYEQRPENATFLEFYWGKWLRANTNINFASYNQKDLTSYLALVEKISKAQAALANTDVVSEGKTAQQLGKLATWDSKGEFAKLSQPYSASKPGKIAYALEYKRTLP